MKRNSAWTGKIPSLRDVISTAFTILWQSVKSFSKNDNSSVAASLAYYSLFAMIPMLLLLFFTLSFFITSFEVVMNRITVIVSQFIPYYTDTILKEVYALAAGKGIWGLIGIVALLWAAMPLMGTIRSAFFNIFKIEERPSVLKTNLLDISVILLILGILVTVSFVNIMLKDVLVLGGSTLLYDIALYLVITGLITGFYFAFIPVKVSFGYILAGSLLTTFLWGIIRPVFGLFLSYNPHYGVAFGSLKALFIVIIWIYYSFSVLLFGTEVIANLRRKDVLMLRGLFYETAHTDRKTQRLKRKFGRDYKEGDIIFNEDEKGTEMFYILSGSIRLVKKEQTLRVMRKGEYFGEMALLIGTPRTTGALAEEDNTSLAVITPENFETLLREEPKIAISFLKELAQRLKITNEIATGAR